jgi:hypothetical protein
VPEEGTILTSNLQKLVAMQPTSPKYQQDVAFNDQKGCSAEHSLQYTYESLQSATLMATGFLEDIPETSIQTRAEIQEESKAKVGETEMDEGC